VNRELTHHASRITYHASRFTFHVPRIKRVTEQQVEVVHSQGQLAIGIRGFLVQVALLETLARAPEAGAEGELFVGIPQCVEETADLLGSLASGVDNAQSGGGFGPAGLDAFEQNALELAAVLRAVGIDAAAAAVVRSTRLSQVRRAQRRLRVADGQAQRPQPLGIIARL